MTGVGFVGRDDCQPLLVGIHDDRHMQRQSEADAPTDENLMKGWMIVMLFDDLAIDQDALYIFVEDASLEHPFGRVGAVLDFISSQILTNQGSQTCHVATSGLMRNQRGRSKVSSREVPSCQYRRLRRRPAKPSASTRRDVGWGLPHPTRTAASSRHGAEHGPPGPLHCQAELGPSPSARKGQSIPWAMMEIGHPRSPSSGPILGLTLATRNSLKLAGSRLSAFYGEAVGTKCLCTEEFSRLEVVVDGLRAEVRDDKKWIEDFKTSLVAIRANIDAIVRSLDKEKIEREAGVSGLKTLYERQEILARDYQKSLKDLQEKTIQHSLYFKIAIAITLGLGFLAAIGNKIIEAIKPFF